MDIFRGDSNEYTQHTNINKKENHPKLCQIQSCLQLWDFLLGIQERVRKSRGKRAVSVRATVVLLYIQPVFH